MWCSRSSSVHRSSPVRNTWTRSGSSRSSSKPYVPACVSRSASCSSPMSSTSKGTCASSGSSTRWKARPSSSGNTVRSVSCRTTRSPTAARSAPTSSAPVSRQAEGMLYVALGPSTWYSTHSRCWAEDNGRRPGRGCTVSAGRAAAAVVPSVASRSASRVTVRASNTVRRDTSTPRAARIRAVSRIASREWPPSAKKSSSTPTPGRPSASANRPQRISSRGVRGRPPKPASAAKSGAGSARRSSLPLGVSGRASRVTKAAGTMCSGRAAALWRWSSAASARCPSAGTTYARSRWSWATTTACPTDGCRVSADSTSPGSTRMPRILTWSSVRPRKASVPSAVHRATSPVRYSREPGSPKGSATKRSAVRPGRSR